MSISGRNSFTTNIRMPDELRDAIRRAAEASGRSFNSEMLVRLMESFGMGSADLDENAEGRAQTNIRLEVETIEQIKTIAAANRRSFSAQIELILREFIASQPQVAA